MLGRDGELAQLNAWAARARDGQAVVVRVAGEPGVGTSALLEACAAALADDGFDVAFVRGESGDELVPLGAVAAVARRWSPDAGARMAAADGPWSAPSSIPVDLAAASARLLDMVTGSPDAVPRALVIDDLDALDHDSQRVLGTVVSRLDADSVLVVVASREALDGSWASIRHEAIVLSPLEEGVLAALAETWAPAAPHVMTEVVARAKGNPLLAREMLLALSDAQRQGRVPIPAVVRPASQLRESIRARLHGLDAGAQRALVVVAADHEGDLGLVRRALGLLGEPDDGLEPAELAGIIECTGGRVTFAHPLFRAAAYYLVAPASRRAAHRALAAACDRPEQAAARAWHMAEASLGADAPAAEALALVADAALRRGAPGVAARAADRAAWLEPDPTRAVQHRALAATAWLLSGNDARAEAAADEAATTVLPDQVAAELLAAVLEATRGPVPGLITAWRDAVSATGTGVPEWLDELLRAHAACREGVYPLVVSGGARFLGGADSPGAVALAAQRECTAGQLHAAAVRLRRALAFGVPGRRWRAVLELTLARIDAGFGVPLPDLGRVRTARDDAARLGDGVLLRAALGVLALSDDATEAAAAQRDLAGLPGGAAEIPAPAQLSPPRHELTGAEMRVARSISEGRTNREAAAELFLSRKTVDFHLQQIFRKLGIRSRTELAVLVSQGVVGAAEPRES